MSTDPWKQLDNQPCRHLRSKEMFYDSGESPDDSDGSGMFWCDHTSNCLGPDGKPAGAEDCAPPRDCFEQ